MARVVEDVLYHHLLLIDFEFKPRLLEGTTVLLGFLHPKPVFGFPLRHLHVRAQIHEVSKLDTRVFQHLPYVRQVDGLTALFILVIFLLANEIVLFSDFHLAQGVCEDIFIQLLLFPRNQWIKSKPQMLTSWSWCP